MLCMAQELLEFDKGERNADASQGVWLLAKNRWSSVASGATSATLRWLTSAMLKWGLQTVL